MVTVFRLLIPTLGRTASAVLLFSALCLALSACGTTSSEPVPRAVSITYDNKLMFYKVEFDSTAVSHREAGRQYAQALGEILPQFESHMDGFLKQTLEEAHMTFDQALQ